MGARYNNAGEPDGYDDPPEVIETVEIAAYYYAWTKLIELISQRYQLQQRLSGVSKIDYGQREAFQRRLALNAQDLAAAQRDLGDSYLQVGLKAPSQDELDAIVERLQDNVRRSAYKTTINRLLRNLSYRHSARIVTDQELERNFLQAASSLDTRRRSMRKPVSSATEQSAIYQYYNDLAVLLHLVKVRNYRILPAAVEAVNQDLEVLGFPPITEQFLQDAYSAPRLKYYQQVVQRERRQAKFDKNMRIISPEALDARYQLYHADKAIPTNETPVS